MKIVLPLVTWIVLLSSTAYSQQLSYKTKNSRFRGEVFFLNLEDGYFGCQVNESTDYLQLYELSKLCDGKQDCFLGSDELSKELKCTNDCDKDGTQCTNGVCLNGVCHCNDGYGGCNCNVQDENECKYRPCDVFSHCTNTLGSFTCTCFPGYRGDGLHCEDIDECQDPSIAARCVENAECCNLPAHFLCKCKDGYEGDGEVLCSDVDECRNPNACGKNANCINTPGNFTCECPEGFLGNPFDGCVDVDECTYPKSCGPRSLCTNLEGSYRCDCPPGYEGDGRSETGCVDDDECARLPCGRNAQCLNTDGSYKCSCPDGYQGDPAIGCEAACILDTECGSTEICQGGQCLNPCDQPQACGMNAQCQMGIHLKQCSCPAGFTGNPDVECVRIPVACTTDQECGPSFTCRDSMCLPSCVADQDCALNEKCLKGNCMLTCRVDNDCFLGHVCLHNKCIFGCHVDDDCSASESCRADKCVNPCHENPCGPNAACTVSNHRASCTCLEGMVPNPTPKVGCVRTPAVGCTENRDCAVGLACFESLCRPFCADDGSCLANERCTNGVCKPLCRRDDDCRNSEVCLGQMCVAGCRSDQGCPDNLVCVGQQCVNPCDNPTACGTNAECSVENHKKLCTCPNDLVGNADVACKTPENSCTTNSNCPPTHLCLGGTCQKKCRNDQNCLSDQRCMRGTCRNVCNTDSACSLGQICENRVCQIGCRNDLTCPSDQSCVNKKCTNPCETSGQCGHCANCLVVNHGVQCSCPNGFTGDGLTGCLMPPQRCNPGCECDESNTYCAPTCIRNDDCPCGQMCSRGRCRQKCGPGKPCPLGQLCERGSCLAGCKVNNDCATDQVCSKNQCVNPCTKPGACGENALCTVSDHHVLCYCPDGYEGEPSKKCVQFECHDDEDCESNKRCDDGKCRNPCLEYGACGINAQCRVVNRRPQCSCPPDFFGNPETECQSLTGVGCATNPCGENSKCRDVPGGFECSCMDGCMGDATKGCVCGETQVNVCHDQPCGLNAACRVADHNEPQCYCPEEYPNGDAYVQCYLTPPKEDCRTNGCNVGECVRQGYDYICKQEIGCTSSNECPSQRACVNALCVDPCSYANPCAKDQECQVKQHHPVCVKVCECQRNSDCRGDAQCDGCHCLQPRESGCEHCPYGTTCDPTTGACIKVECTRNEDCGITEACIGEKCQHPCDVHNPCAFNAICINTNHGSDCSCEDGYQGNGFIGCQPAQDVKSVCQYNEDCPPDKLCDRLNRRCVNPCMEDSCGENAECIPANHGIECHCFSGFVGNAYVECQRVQGCRSDSECDSNEACVNGKCSSPCRCGLNALCDVVNHQGVCKCPPGYGGNPEISCNPPTNPCEPNPCGVNALCELDRGSPICFCPKGLTGNPFKNCIPEGDECSPNPCGPNSGCRVVSNSPICFCLPEYEGQPPNVPCELPTNPCDPSPCGPNTQCTILSNGFSKCTCLPNYVESPNTIRGCVAPVNPCDPNPCGQGAVCDSGRDPVCFCPDNKVGNPFKLCQEPAVTVELCRPGPCGRNADCYIVGNREQCYCSPGYVGDPYGGCREPPRSACEPNPCGPNALCSTQGPNERVCSCPQGLVGDPTSPEGCQRYECQVDSDCANDKACMGFKCYDPCPGACGVQANCRVEEHHPVCTCNPGLTGNPGIRCFSMDSPKTSSKNPCQPSPCGLNTECKVMNNRAVCSCLPEYLGDPQSGCRPECVINSDCGPTNACINRKCVDPCAASVCGINALCKVIQHTPTCACIDGYVGDSFLQCIPVYKNVTRDPCNPSPCGPSDICSVYGDGVALCDPCFGPDAIHNPRCRPECLSNSDCPFDRACVNQNCLDPCPGSCGHNAVCYVYEHRPVCSCPQGLFGNPYEHCSAPSPVHPTKEETCNTVRCGANADCKRGKGGLVCVCKKGYFGDALVGCRPECVLNSDCSMDKSCVNTRCVDSCVGVCGLHADCHVVNHSPVCICQEGYAGDAFTACHPFYLPPADKKTPGNPCEPSPCGPNSRCFTTPEGYAACSCLPGYRGAPPVCQAECVVSSECALNKACINQKCTDPCPGTCGIGARCEVLNHNPVCGCEPGFEGDPFVSCSRIPAPTDVGPTKRPTNPCLPSPCGPNSICQVKQGRPVCSCVANYVGSPPYCRPECSLNSECPLDKACIQEKCQNPCENSCGLNARCTVISHSAHCSCDEGYEGDAFVGCSPIPEKPRDRVDPCYPNPCAENAVCSDRNGAHRCTCIDPYIGDPYTTGCRPECVYSSECPSSLACIKQHCRDPCVGNCGTNAECSVVNHVPTCSCQRGYEGDPFTGCKREPTHIGPRSPCEPSPCGPNSLCRVIDGRPTCSCQVGYFGSPPSCRPECVVSSECNQNLACINQKCVDPCAGTCGFNAKCQVVNHNPICSCPTDFIGDPFEQCDPKPLQPTPTVNPCIPSPCGPNAECREMDSRAVCTCSTGMFGAPPNCRPECVIHQDCPSNRACIRQRCEDPCIGACGFNAVCSSQNHKPICSCIEGHEGDPYAGCNMRQVVPDFVDPCHPSPCGSNAICKERNGAGSCTCMQNYFGDPYLNCRPECVQNSDCPRTKSCANMKCVDPCVDLCGINSECRVNNHLPVCSCAPGYTGNPLRICHLIPETKAIEPIRNPCRPSPCGLYSTCQVNANRPVCSCLPDYIGSPPNCRPECVISSECASDKACINQRCRDPCPGTCGNNARCRVTNHSPICTCARGYTGDPFTLCVAVRIPPIAREPTKPTNPCVPSPCGSNSQCRVANTGAVCSCVANYVGRPPNCRPECTINSECPSHLACMNTRCSDPCLGSCGSNAVCSVRSHVPICMCNQGYTGDPFSGCFREIPQLPESVTPCTPSPCGVNAVCQERNRAASCKCIPEYFGDPYVECRPECVINTDCVKSKACVNNKCIDPCPGMCGYNAECSVVNHSPHCDCLPGYTGNPISGCHLIPQDPIVPLVQTNPCQPSPCGLYSNCRAVNGHAVCSCIASYIGAPPNCRPECMSSSECAQDRSCINQHCKDPCPGTCGLNAKCRTVNHNPICTCMPGFTGDPFLRCIYEEKKIIAYPKDVNPCVPSPCGPNSQCRVVGQNEHAICSCLPNYIGRAPNCRPECTSNSECPGNRACINQRCQDPCVGSCGSFTTCTVNKHRPVCRCIDHYSGDPFAGCSPIIEIPPEKAEPCNPSPCGANAVCKERNGAGSCTCLPDYTGDPYSECRPECVLNSDCAKNRACVNNKCRDPCPGVCGVAAECHVINHAPSCSCPSGFTGNPSEYCREIQIQKTPIEPCRPSPCGPYSNCREVNGHAVCSCLQNHIGSPPACRPECSVSSECSQDKACLNLRCVDPCPGTCGQQALCKVTNHNPICSCPASFTGDPFIRCIKEELEPTPTVRQGNPCVPSPCGPNSQCREVRETPVCSCLPNFIGRAPNCRPECTINSECPANLACVNDRCKDPCPGSCGFNAFCNVVNHSPVCSCKSGFSGDPFSGCNPTPIEIPNENISPCNPSPCGPNAQCKERNGAGSCTCLDEYFGDPYSGCRPECVTNSDCPRDKSCNSNKCVDPCPGVCGRNAECHVVNHAPNCACLPGYTGNALSACHEIQQAPLEPKTQVNPCVPSPCGPYSQCRETNGHAVCSCQNNFIGSPPNCRPECVVSSECPQDKSCENQKCIDPCPGTCGPEARCQVINHYAACSCPPGYTGDPFNRCEKILFKPVIPTGNPCVPSPCGPNSKCIEVGDSPACSCLSNYIGRPPNCRPECISSSECPANLACINQKCSDPCAGACGIHTLCNVIKHNAQCQCESGYTGDPFSGCSFIERIQPTDEPRNPCNPSPCGANAVCRERNGVGSCSCLPEYSGDPYSGCRPECVQNSDCDRTRACINNKCQDPCPGVCGLNAECRVLNHAPNCLCIEGFTGDAHSACSVIETVTEAPTNPCHPSPCGSYSQCHEINGHAVCSCNEGYVGAPPNCKPECVVSSECPQNRACINTKCSDPCPGTCGSSARCQVVNHNPICTCPPGLTGDPFVSCIEQSITDFRDSENPCVPSPCGPNSLCREIGNQAACSCQANYVGRPPNCRPECTNNDECQNNLACQNERCLDPCPGSCGNNAVCKVVQHNPVCTCSDGFEGDALVGCTQIIRAISTEAPSTPCDPSPCGPHAECRERNGAGACYCHEGFEGNAYDTERGCRRECEVNDDCQIMQACVRFKCVDPCDNICGDRAICGVENHVPTCTCPPGLTGDPFFQCKEIPVVVAVENPCVPSPCGPNSICRSINNQAVCSCQSGFVDQPPNCKPECVVSSECSPERACVNNKCVDPCPHTCGIGALCTTKNHSPICTCPRGQTGDPFVQCTKIPIIVDPEPTERPPSCVPSPCGPNSKCQVVGGSPACSCLPDFIGSPPSCRPECVLNSECGPTEACINQKCRDPCPGSCGFEARCHVLNHVPICNCIDGYTGDPFVRCNILPPSTMKPLTADPCNPSPCGPNADCFNGECRCQDNYQGNPYDGCRPECTLSADCPRDKACLRNKCVDPCPGTCGINARCEVITHIPVCSCVDGYEGDPFTSCRQKAPVETTRTLPCSPSPCGANSQCRDINDHAVCSCLDGYIGAPPQCRPECVINSECSATQACVNKKCIDPCSGSCGIDARCEVINHSPICGCPPGKTGDPFKRCTDIPVTPIEKTSDVPQDPCVPSPCGPNSVCRAGSSGPSCQCLPEFFGSPPNCRPECIINPDCSSTQACINNKCRDPCPGSCGTNAECRVISHTVSCSCPIGFGGNAFVQCIQQDVEEIKPCEPSPCGQNAECIERNGAASCKCIDEYQGDPYEGCRPECVLSSDCPTDKACIRNKCKDPCPGVCGQNAECYSVNHLPNCVCITGYSGDPFTQCHREVVPTVPTVSNPCSPSPCGPNSKCREANGVAVCSCLDAYIGAPPNCKPECTVNAECPQNKACHKFKCANPCAGTCGIEAKCEVINHNPICSCPLDMTGDPFTRCHPTPVTKMDKPSRPLNPCVPNPCGLYSECRSNGETPSCSCLPAYIGSPPNCRPECIVNTDCGPDMACIAEKCRNPCEGSCGINSECRIQNHIPICTCRPRFTGDPFSQCVEIIEEPEPTRPTDPCDLQPCGANADCDAGVCTCLPDYFGDPYVGCRPECTLSTDCSPNKACINRHCIDPCPGTCGEQAQCDVSNHIPICSCPKGYTGDPFIRCRPEVKDTRPTDPCNPSPCGPNSICHSTVSGAVCACQAGMLGSPPACKPECLTSSECSLQTACLNKKCVDPCPGACGQYAKCQVINHNPVCSCNAGFTGDPFTRCFEQPIERTPIDPCQPTPCGPNSDCKVINDSPACSCLETFIGTPPNCRPECTINPECPSTKACIRQKCDDPCPGSCGYNARCSVANHMPICSCENGFTGDPFTGCQQVQEPPPTPKEPKNPCYPSPCGINSECQVRGDSFTCECVNDYIGNPYEGCRPECVGNSECSANRACIRYKCADPCPGTCGIEAICTIHNHIPVCSCPAGMTGDAFRQCTPVVRNEEPQKSSDPCYPSPCGANSICKTVRGNAVCECLPGYFGNPIGQGCRPECTLSSDCAKNLACVNSKCVDPCPGVCGYGAQCQVVNHNPICSCPSLMIGNPFVECHTPTVKEPVDPCNPSPCRSNGNCRVINGAATCTYPECVTNEECPRDRACVNQKCRDPCINACGVNAICSVINHKALCTCPTGYYGSPYNQCTPQMDVVVVPQPECTSDNDCSNDKACINQECKNPCEQANICGQNAKCHVQLHRPLCVCNEGFTGNAQTFCHVVGCRSDDECPANEACINKKCTDPCLYTQCGTLATCRADYNHKARCYCPEGYRGNPQVQCVRPECTRDDDCAFHLACLNERCEDPCNCGAGAQCRVDNHRALCRCPPGYSGDPTQQCKIVIQKETPQCTVDADCPSKYACFSGECKNPCLVTKPCGTNAICSVVDTLPLRTMMCQCEPGYIGDADVGCRKEPQKDQGCRSHEDCADTEACRNGDCMNPCLDGTPCARTAECLAQRHRAVCSCPSGLLGDPFVNCYEEPKTVVAGCTHDSDCAPSTACINRRCQDPCAEGNPCAGNAECRVSNYRPLCFCPAGWVGDPQVQCYKPECKTNSECPYDKACINENCVNPCTFGSVRCGSGAQCQPQNHQAVCVCPAGTQGNPFVSCIAGHCQYNEDCADHEACDRLNRVCRPVCDDDTCAVNAICTGRRHQPQCVCRQGMTGDPFVECVGFTEPPRPKPECEVDSDCPTQLACMNNRCANPCAVPNVCTPQQTCTVLDTLPLRTMICKCPSDMVTDNSRNCVPIKHDVISGCQVNEECANSEVCQQGHCIEACRLDRCGLNAQCRSKDHYAQCTCPIGYEGNPRVECNPIDGKTPIRIPSAECYRNEDCSSDQKCRNERCINPCSEDPCGRGAYCHVENRIAICRCPPGYNGDARVACIPPTDVSTIGCKSNSDCSASESCVNEQCINPCNCGNNAECIVRNHHPVCYCKAGFSGNAQYGCVQIGCSSDDECSLDKQCMNRECVNPCLLSDPCALNAECFGRNHRATCRCPQGLEGDPFTRCLRIECRSDYDCSSNQACVANQCINPCLDSPCAQNAICNAINHAAVCRCPETAPLGNPFSYCERRVVEPQCVNDADCPSRLACIDNKCKNPCIELSPCASSARCSVLDSVPVRTMVCVCPESHVPDARGECKPIILQTPPGCTADSDCLDNEACVNRQCRNPCNCGTNAICNVQNHRAICSCQDGFDGNPYATCRSIGCRVNGECDSGKACINGNCVSPCLVNDPCGINAECYVQGNEALCRCNSGYRGNAYERCRVIGCRTNSDCPSDKNCINEQCVNPCIYDNPCSSRAECKPQNHIAICRCPSGFMGNPYIDCQPDVSPECTFDTDCPSRLACINNECQDPCSVLEPCNRPARCEVTPTSPVRTMICICPDGYISSGSGTCKPTKAVITLTGGCISDPDCPADKSCISGVCRDPCRCGLNAECRIKDHKPVCTCRQGFEGNPEFECSKVECFSDSACPSTHSCMNGLCIPACQEKQCGKNSECIAVNHRGICECAPGFGGNPRFACVPVGCRTDTECPSDKACVNNKCQNPCDTTAVCAIDQICKVYQHRPQCACPPGTISRKNGCVIERSDLCVFDAECPTQTACIGGECVNPCNATTPCGVNANCRVLDTVPVRTMICECLEGYTGNAAVQCDKRSLCVIEKGFVRDINGQCICPPGSALDVYEYCTPCVIENGFKIDETGHCMCALERGMVVDERGRCICPVEHGYRLTKNGECVPTIQAECQTDEECADNRYCNTETRTCEDPCLTKTCGINAFCNTINHKAICQCNVGYTGNADEFCNHTNFRTDFPRPEMIVSCLADGVQVQIHLPEPGFNGVLYVKGHSKDEDCRRVVNLSGESAPRNEIFKVHFGSCGLMHVNGIASFVLVIQKHPKLVTYKAQAYNIKCVYQTGEKNVTLGFNVSMLTTAGTIANTGPPPICQMRIITHNGQEINSAEIGDNLMLQVDVEPSTIYGGFARSCIAKTMEDNVENEYIVTDENGCATDPTIFGEWEYNPDTNSLLASFNAFKFPSSDNIRFQCNIRVCFGKCQPVNCRGYNAFGRRRRRAIADNSTSSTAVSSTNGGMEGTLREEITIQSNAILTFEKREGGSSDSSIKPAAQRVEDICVSMVGLIIALVITALLALVAVAVAVSCWLMAYRRRPKSVGPLPHPPEFPNPLFSNPEAIPEPTPDYLS